MKIFKRVIMTLYFVVLSILLMPFFSMFITLRGVWKGQLDTMKGFGSNLTVQFMLHIAPDDDSLGY